MGTFKENMSRFRSLLEDGNLQTAYQEFMRFFSDLRRHFENNNPGFSVPTNIYYGYMDMTYFAIITPLLTSHNLKVGVVFDYAHCKPVPMHAFRFSRVLVRKKRFGTHAQEGMFSLSGPGIRSNHRVSGCHIADITPTLLYLLGQPVPEDFDGRAITDIFEENYIRNHPVEYTEPEEIKLHRSNQEETYSAEESAAVAARLRDLGYME